MAGISSGFILAAGTIRFRNDPSVYVVSPEP